MDDGKEERRGGEEIFVVCEGLDGFGGKREEKKRDEMREGSLVPQERDSQDSGGHG